MDREYVDSSMIRGIGYDSSACILEVEFSDGVVWQYFDFSESEWYAFHGSSSKGRYFHSHIKDRFTGSRVN